MWFMSLLWTYTGQTGLGEHTEDGWTTKADDTAPQTQDLNLSCRR